MNGKKIHVPIVLLFILLLDSVILSQNKLNIYGFLDVGFKKMDEKKNNFFQMSPLANINPQLFLGNVNLYFDFNPNEYTRSLVEIALNSNIFDKPIQPGTSITMSEDAEQELYTMIYGYTLMQGADEATARATAAGAVATAKDGFSAAAQQYQQGIRYGGIKLERAWCEIKKNDQFNIRFGRFLTPAGIWNVDHGSPLILTINQPYQTNQLPVFPTAQNGVMVHGRMFFGDHDFDYKAYISSGRDDSCLNNIVTAKLKDFGAGGHLGLHLDFIDGINVGVSGYTGRIKTNRLVQEFEFTNAEDITEQNITIDKFIYTWYVNEVSREYCFGIDGKLRFKNILLQSEYNYRRMENNRLDNAVTPIHAYYILVAYEATVNQLLGFTPYFFYESFSWKNTQLNPVVPLYVMPFNGWKQINMGLNTRLFTNVRLKLEYGMSLVDVNNKPYNPLVDPDSDDFNKLTDSQKYNAALRNNYDDDELNSSVISAQVSIAF